MNYDQSALRTAQVQAFKELGKAGMTPDGKVAIPSVPLPQITADAVTRQELLFINTRDIYRFEFGSGNASPAFIPDPAGLSNINLGDNDIFAMYGIKIELGVGVNIGGRVYNAFGTNAFDDTLYAGQLLIKWASNEPVEQMPMQIFRETTNQNGWAGFQFIRPIRKWVGSVSQVQVTIDIPTLAGLALTANQTLRVTLHGALGVA